MRLLSLLSAIVAWAAMVAGGAAFAETAKDEASAKVVTQLGHAARVGAVVFSPDGNRLLSGSSDNTVKLWDVASGRLLRTFNGAGTVVTVAFSPDSKRVLSGSLDGKLKLWEAASGRLLRSIDVYDDGSSSDIHSVAFSPDGKRFLSGGSGAWLQSGSMKGALRLWDAETGELLRAFEGHTGFVHSVAFSPDGARIVSASGDNTLKLWDAATGELLRSLEGHKGEVDLPAFSLDGGHLLSLSRGSSLKLWDIDKGQLLGNFEGETGRVLSVALSADGKRVVAGSHDGTLKLWDVASEALLLSFEGHAEEIHSVAFSPDGARVVSGGSDKTLKLWDDATGTLIRSFEGYAEPVWSIAISPPHVARFVSGTDDGRIWLWNGTTGQLLHNFKGHTGPVNSVAFSPLGTQLVSGGQDKTLKLWDTASGTILRRFEGHSEAIRSVAFSPEGARLLSGSGRPYQGSLELWDATNGQPLHTFECLTETHAVGPVNSVAFSPDGGRVVFACGGNYGMLMLWDAASGELLRSFDAATSEFKSVAFSPDGKQLVSGSDDGRVWLWDAANGHLLHEIRGHDHFVTSVAFSPDGRRLLSGSLDQTLKLWDTGNGQLLRTFEGHTGGILSVAFAPAGNFVLSGSLDGTTCIWQIATGKEMAETVAAHDGAWLTATPEGFFTSSKRDTDMLSIVRGVTPTTLGQVYQSLFNPDLVREALAGDPDGEVKQAAEVINLEQVLDAGPPPAVAITSHEPDSRSGKDLVTMAARIADRGKGVGRIEWRINGVTAGVRTAPAHAGPVYEVSQELALDPGENRIEVIAYEGRNVLASLPAQTTVIYNGPPEMAKPKLYILAIGINAYVDRGGKDPASGETLVFSPLTASVADATAFSAEMEKAGSGLYSQVRVTLALDASATVAKLDETFRKLSSEISPRDTFVFYAAAHGYTVGGNYYMIPQDYQGGPVPDKIKARAIGQDRLQDWIANRIRARKAIILLDTCESGALTGGYTKSRTEGPVSEAAIGRLHEATGRPVLTAASGGKSAYEGYKGHGVFTSALMEALHKGDTNSNGKIEVTELAAHIEKRVPELFAELKQSGWVVKGLSAPPVRRGEEEEEDKTQTAHFGSTGEDFAIVARLP